MRYIILLSLFLLPSCSNSKSIPLEGMFVSNGEKTIHWMIESNHPWVESPDWEKYQSIYQQDNPLLHSWSNGTAKVGIPSDMSMTIANNWTVVDEKTFKKTVSADNMEHDQFVTLVIISTDEYYIDTEADDKVFREYFIRRKG